MPWVHEYRYAKAVEIGAAHKDRQEKEDTFRTAPADLEDRSKEDTPGALTYDGSMDPCRGHRGTARSALASVWEPSAAEAVAEAVTEAAAAADEVLAAAASGNSLSCDCFDDGPMPACAASCRHRWRNTNHYRTHYHYHSLNRTDYRKSRSRHIFVGSHHQIADLYRSHDLAHFDEYDRFA